MSSDPKTYSFDDWAELFKQDPEMFEEKRQEFLESYITNMYDDPEQQQRAKAILWRMEQNYRHIKDPIARFNKVVEHFWEQVNSFKEALDLFDK